MLTIPYLVLVIADHLSDIYNLLKMHVDYKVYVLLLHSAVLTVLYLHMVVMHQFFRVNIICLFSLLQNILLCVQQLVTPCFNMPNSTCSWISTKYRTLHYHNITYVTPIMAYEPYRVCSV